MIDFKNKKVAVLGMGIEGESTARFLLKNGADVITRDKQKAKSKKEREDYLKGLDQFDIVVRSPGIKRDLPEILKAEQKGVIITSHTKIFFDLCPAKIIGVTGTKGKGTTSALIYEMLKMYGKDVYLGGNIGKPPLDFLDKLNAQSWVVLELSSFQLFDISRSPHIAVVLMVTQEHLDYHKDVSEYINAKRNILRFQSPLDFAVINRDYPASNESDIHTDAKVFQVSRERECEQGCYIKNGKVILRTLGKLRKPANQNVRQSEFSEIEVIKTSDILLPGEHNLENVCAAAMAATLAGVAKQNIVKVLKTFKGLEHRLELVREVGGVRYYDDSFSTTPETAIAAIKAFKQPEILILGGSSKASDFTELGRVISTAKNIKAIIGIGVEWQRMKAQFKVQSIRQAQDKSSKFKVIEGCKNMREIVLAAFDAAQPGDVVLLSPGCASFDMFKNYKDRGEQFKKEVNSL